MLAGIVRLFPLVQRPAVTASAKSWSYITDWVHNGSRIRLRDNSHKLGPIRVARPLFVVIEDLDSLQQALCIA